MNFDEEAMSRLLQANLYHFQQHKSLTCRVLLHKDLVLRRAKLVNLAGVCSTVAVLMLTSVRLSGRPKIRQSSGFEKVLFPCCPCNSE